MFQFASIWWVILFIPLFIIYFYYRKKQSGSFIFSNVDLIKELNVKTINYRKRKFILRFFVLIFLIIAMMRPQSVDKTEEILTHGVDIMLVLDTSTSMLAMDFQPNNRLDASKEVVADFIKSRKSDRIGMVIFSGYSFTQCPITTDYGVLLQLLEEVAIGKIEDGTAIGMAIATSVKRLKESKAKSKIIILLTDGMNNAGKIDPVTSANLAKSLGIKIYTIGVGKHGKAPFPVDDPIWGKRIVHLPTKIDEKLLRKISDMTDGLYFRAYDKEKLADIYDTINELEKTEIKTKEYFKYKEFFPYFLWTALIFMMLEVFYFYIWKPKFP